MWVELICGLVIYRVVRRFFSAEDDTFDQEAVSGSCALFSVADRLEKIYGGKAYVGLRIPDADTSSHQNIDVILLKKGEAMIISVKNFSGSVSIDVDGRWACTGGSKNKTEHHQDPVEESKKQVAILKSYLEQRGVVLPEGYLSCKVVCPNPNFRNTQSSYFPSEVVTYKQWMTMKPESDTMVPGWIKGAFRGWKKDMQESIYQTLSFALCTAPMWDRIELKGNKYVLGDFLEFKGKLDDIHDLRNIRRSKVSRLIFQQTSMFGLASSKLQVLYSPRDYRNGGVSSSEWKEISIRSSTEVLFQPQSSSKVCKFKLSLIVSMSLSA